MAMIREQLERKAAAKLELKMRRLQRDNQYFVEQRFKLFALFTAGEQSAFCVGYKKRVDDDAIATRDDFRAQNVQACRGERASDFAEQTGAVPGADMDRGVAAVGFVMP